MSNYALICFNAFLMTALVLEVNAGPVCGELKGGGGLGLGGGWDILWHRTGVVEGLVWTPQLIY